MKRMYLFILSANDTSTSYLNQRVYYNEVDHEFKQRFSASVSVNNGSFVSLNTLMPRTLGCYSFSGDKHTQNSPYILNKYYSSFNND